MAKLPYLNLGCGANFRRDWTNIDIVSDSPDVIAHNLVEGIPFPDRRFEFVYHSHVMEHLPRSRVHDFIRECFRVLQPGGILRVVIPNLEEIALHYLRNLNDAWSGIPGADARYEWMLLEMYDQVVRTSSGGAMFEYVRHSHHDDDFVVSRLGVEAEQAIQTARAVPKPDSRSSVRKLASRLYRSSPKEAILKIILGHGYRALEESRFRTQGEIHRWMYDRYSVRKLLEGSSFTRVELKTATTSYLRGFHDFALDEEHGRVRKPDSLFMEAIKA